MIRRRIPIALSLATTVVLATSGSLSAAGTTTVNVRDDYFSPKTKTISKNTTVVWRWRDDGDHDVKSRGTRKFRSSTIKTSGTHRVTFTRAGTYRYVCTVHEFKGMTGKIVVK